MSLINAINGSPAGFVWVDFGASDPGIGTFDQPYSTLTRGIDGVPVGGTIVIKGPASTPEGIPISKPMTITSVGGQVKIGSN
jgi:hypothetical protein